VKPCGGREMGNSNRIETCVLMDTTLILGRPA
jgi:hypothetical protein